MLQRLERLVLVGLFVAMLIIGCLQIINRYALNLPIWNTELLLPHLFVVMTFLGLATAFRYHAHIVVDILPTSLPEKLQCSFLIIVWMICCVFLGVLIYAAISVTLFQLEINAVTNMKYPAAILTVVVPVGCFLSIVNIVRFEILPLITRLR